MIIRKAEAKDASTIFDFVVQLDRDTLPSQGQVPVREPVITPDDIVQAGFSGSLLFEAFIAEETDSTPLGVISFFRGYSGWPAKATAFVHMLFVTEQARGKGVGRCLIEAVARTAVDRGWVRLQLFVEDERPARYFYEALGLSSAEELHYQIEGASLKALASRSS